MYHSLLGKPTDQDLERYPAVHLTGPHEWDPSVLDYTQLLLFSLQHFIIILWKYFNDLFFVRGDLSPINDVFISPPVTNDSKLQGKFMPTFFCVIKLVYFYASQVILIITHFDEIYSF